MKVLFLIVSIFIIAAISFDRFYMISSVSQHTNSIVVYNLFIWSSAFILALPNFYFADVIVYSNGDRECKVKWILETHDDCRAIVIASDMTLNDCPEPISQSSCKVLP